MSKFNFENKKSEVISTLVASGVHQDHAETVADCFVTADLYGVTSHGTAILPSHIQRIERGGYNLEPKFKIVKETAAFSLPFK